MDQLDQAVGQQVCAALAEPGRLEEEYRRRMQPEQQASAVRELTAQASKVQRGIARLIDSYADRLIEPGEFEPRVKRLRQQLEQLERQIAQRQSRSRRKRSCGRLWRG